MNATRSARWTAHPEAHALAAMLGIPAHLATLLASLYAGQTVRADRPSISHLRKALECEAIDTTPDGYHLTSTGMAECARAIGEFRNWINGRYAA